MQTESHTKRGVSAKRNIEEKKINMKKYYEFESERELAEYCIAYGDTIPEKIGIGKGWTKIYKLLHKNVVGDDYYKTTTLYYYCGATRLIITYYESPGCYDLDNFIKEENINGKIKTIYTINEIEFYLDNETERKIDRMSVEIREGN